MTPILLEEALDARIHGGKAVGLARAIRAGLPVPGGVVFDVGQVEALACGDVKSSDVLVGLEASLDNESVAVRSSAVGEDSTCASFAGQHATLLNVCGPANLLDAIREVYASGRSPSAVAYRRRLGITSAVQVAVVLQTMILPECAGVLFTRNPVTGADERVVEASWGLGEAVVSGLVTPDRWLMRRGGAVTNFVPGYKDVEIKVIPGGGTVEVEVPAGKVERPCLSSQILQGLERLAEACESFFGHSPSRGKSWDIEWAVADGRLYLLQCRPVTR